MIIGLKFHHDQSMYLQVCSMNIQYHWEDQWPNELRGEGLIFPLGSYEKKYTGFLSSSLALSWLSLRLILLKCIIKKSLESLKSFILLQHVLSYIFLAALFKQPLSSTFLSSHCYQWSQNYKTGSFSFLVSAFSPHPHHPNTHGSPRWTSSAPSIPCHLSSSSSPTPAPKCHLKNQIIQLSLFSGRVICVLMLTSPTLWQSKKTTYFVVHSRHQSIWSWEGNCSGAHA